MSELIPLSKFRNEVGRYNPETILQLCSHASKSLDDQGKTVQKGTVTTRIGHLPMQKNVAVTHHGLAMVAMLALRQHPWSKGREPRLEDIIRLVNNVDHIEYPLPESVDDVLMTLIRVSHQQWPFQEGMLDFIPRHVLLYLKTAVPSPSIDPKSVFLDKTGITLEEFMAIGMLMYAAGLRHHTFPREYLENTEVALLRPYVTSDKLTAFLSVAGADFKSFRQMCLNEEREYPDAGPYQFNPLFSRPVIIRKDGLLCLPVPRLAIHRVTRGLYYDLQEEFSELGGNPFAEWFGHAFEDYGGLLLRDTFGEKNVFPEPRYGRSEIGGPDWTIIRQDTALVLEFRSGRLHKRAKTYADYQEIITLLKRNIVETLLKLPQKIEDLKSGKTGTPVVRDMRYIPAVVTYEPLYPHGLMLQLIRQELSEKGMSDFDFELMSIEDLEWLLAWATHGDPLELLHNKWSNVTTKDKSIRDFIGDETQEHSVTNLRNPLLERTWAQYLGKLMPTDELDGYADWEK